MQTVVKGIHVFPLARLGPPPVVRQVRITRDEFLAFCLAKMHLAMQSEDIRAFSIGVFAGNDPHMEGDLSVLLASDRFPEEAPAAPERGNGC
jgi:hypothetical protein